MPSSSGYDNDHESVNVAIDKNKKVVVDRKFKESNSNIHARKVSNFAPSAEQI